MVEYEVNNLHTENISLFQDNWQLSYLYGPVLLITYRKEYKAKQTALNTHQHHIHFIVNQIKIN